MNARWRRILAASLSAAIFALSPGLGGYSAAAGWLSKTPKSAPILPVPAVLARPSVPAAMPLAAAAGGLDGKNDAVRLDALYDHHHGFHFYEPDDFAVPEAPEPASAQDLGRLSIDDLVALARNGGRAEKERRSAVAAIARLANVAAMRALETIGTADPEADAAGYRIKHAALKALAEAPNGLAKLVSLPPISEAHEREVLQLLRQEKPEVAAFDYDGTIAAGDAPTPEGLRRDLAAAARQGTEVMILTGRSALAAKARDMILPKLAAWPAPDRAVLSLGADSGAQLFYFDREGAPRRLRAEPAWTPEQRATIDHVIQGVGERYGFGSYEGRSFIGSDFHYTVFLKDGLSPDQVEEAARFLEERIGPGVRVEPHASFDGRPLPNLRFSKHDKALGVTLLREWREALTRYRDIERRLPRFLRRPARWLLGSRGGEVVPAAKTLMVGNDFGPDEHVVDVAMPRGAPEGLAISVGGSADPRIEGEILVWRKTGPEGAAQLAQALAAPSPVDGNARALKGLFFQRTFGIVAFMATSIAFPLIARPVVNVPGQLGYATLVALGQLATIVAAPLTGRLIDKMTMRNSMLLNGAVRAAALLAMPAFSLLHALNFWTLLVCSIANFFLMASMMTVENSYIKTLAGSREVKTMNGLLQINYLLLQVLLGGVLRVHHLGFGDWIDHFNLLYPYYGAALIHALVILPTIWFFIPNRKLSGSRPQAAAASGPSFVRRYGFAAILVAAAVGFFAFMRSRWASAAALASWLPRHLPAGVASWAPWIAAHLPLLASPLLITGALGYWISRTPEYRSAVASRNLKNSGRLMGLSVMMVYQIQYIAIPAVAFLLAGASGAGQLMARLLGALFLGQLLSNASLAKLETKRRFPVLGRLSDTALIRAGAVLLTGVWSYASLMPGHLGAALGAAAAAAVLIAAGSHLTDRGWLKHFGLGLATIFLPVLFWGSQPALFSFLILVGFAYGATMTLLGSYYQMSARGMDMGKAMGVYGVMFNVSISVGFGAYALITALTHAAFPATFAAMGGLFLAAAVPFYFSPRLLPGLARSSWSKKP